MKPTIVTVDIETAPRVGLFFGPTYDANIAKVIAEMYVLGFSYKPLGKKVKSCFIWDFPLYKSEPTNDYEVALKWAEIASQSDILIGHNSRSFDDKVMMSRLMVHNIPPPEPWANVDTKNAVKRVAKFDSHKLDDLGESLGIGRKKQTGGIELWWACMQGDKKAQKKMVKYCEQDVNLTEKLYLKERPYMANHPALNVLSNKPKSCPKCGSTRIYAGMKYRATNTNLYQYFRCNDCGGNVRNRIPEYKQANEKMEYSGA